MAAMLQGAHTVLQFTARHSTDLVKPYLAYEHPLDTSKDTIGEKAKVVRCVRVLVCLPCKCPLVA